MNLAIVILNWNAAEDTINCVRRIAEWTQIKPVTVIVDNASKDNSIEVIRQSCPDVELICNEENLGFTGGTNRGIMRVLSRGDMPVLLLNNDAFIPEDDVIRLLKTLLETQTIGIIGPLLYDAEQEGNLISAGGRNPIMHHQTRILDLQPGEPVRLVEYVSGTAVIIKPEIFRTVGYLDETYFFSTELADLCMRARQAGYLSAIDIRARAYHTLSRSGNLRETLYVYYIVRNRFIFIRNSPYRFKILFFIFWSLYGLALSLKLRFTGKKPVARAVLLALKDGLQQRFGGQNERILSACSATPEPSSVQ